MLPEYTAIARKMAQRLASAAVAPDVIDSDADKIIFLFWVLGQKIEAPLLELAFG